MVFGGTCNKEEKVRERLAYLIVICMLILLVTFVLAVLGKGEWQAPSRHEQEKGSISHSQGPLL